MLYLDYDFVLKIHDRILEIEVWLPWTKDPQQIQSILQHVQNDEYYPSISLKATHLLFSICKFHCFNDGNKRTSLVCTKIFLEINWFETGEFLVNMEDIIVEVARGKIEKHELWEILFDYVIKTNT